MALGADAVAIGTAALIALGDNHPRYAARIRARSVPRPASTTTSRTGATRSGITTQDPELAARLDPVEGGRRLANYLRVLTMEAQTIARACGKAHLHHLEPEDLVALTVEAAAMARVPLAGTDWIPGRRYERRSDLRADVVIVGGGLRGLRRRLGPEPARRHRHRRRRARTPSAPAAPASPAGVVRCHYGVSSLAAMATPALECSRTPRRSSGRTSASTRPATSWASARRTSTPCAPRWPTSAPSACAPRTSTSTEVRKLWPVADLEPLRRLRVGGARRVRRRVPDRAGLRRRRPPRRRPAPAGHDRHRDPDVGRPDDRRPARPTAPRSPPAPSSLAAGPWSVALLAAHGIELPITVHREQIVLVDPGVRTSARCRCSPTWCRCSTSAPRASGELLFGNSDLATLEPADPDRYSEPRDRRRSST